MNGEQELVVDLISALESLRKTHWRPEVELPITPSEMNLLLTLYQHCDGIRQGIQPSELGELMQIARPTVTALLNSVEGAGYVRRRPGQTDRRAVLVELTEAGEAFVCEGRRMFFRHMARLVEFLGERDAQELIRLVRRVQQFSEMGKSKCGN